MSLISFADKKVLIVGLGKSGLASARFAADRGARVFVTDTAPEAELSSELASLEGLIAGHTLGTHRDDDFVKADLIVVSPGVPLSIGPLKRARKRGIEIIGELGLAAKYVTAPLIAVSGTNGKTTCCRLLGRMIEESGRSVFVGGNIGRPLMELVLEGTEVEVAVAEVSSFQIDTAPDLKPKVAVLTNVRPDHQDRYGHFIKYAASKLNLFRRQRPGDVAVLNAEDRETMQGLRRIFADKLFFGSRLAHRRGAFYRPHEVVLYDDLTKEGSFSLAEWGPPGRHNVENLMACVLAAGAMGVGAEAIGRAIDTFSLQPHRIETVGEVDGVKYVNDSKATNIDAVVRAIESFEAPPILLLGGRDKGGDWRPLIDFLPGRIKRLVVFGEAGPNLARIFRGFEPEVAGDLPGAVEIARRSGLTGDVVLLSPGCASFDQYQSYGHRGDHFKELVEGL